jgi:hypothetical protein
LRKYGLRRRGALRNDGNGSFVASQGIHAHRLTAA